MKNRNGLKRLPYLLPVLLIMLLVLFVPSGWESSQAMSESAQVVVKPPDGNLIVRREYLIEVWVEDIVDLYGADVRLSFNPTMFTVLDSDPILPGIQIQPVGDFLAPDFLVKNSADNTSGTIWYVVSQAGDIHPNPVDGSGVLFRFVLRVIGDGNGELDITYSKLSNKNGEEIPSLSSDAEYDLNYGVDTYLPLLFSLANFY